MQGETILENKNNGDRNKENQGQAASNCQNPMILAAAFLIYDLCQEEEKKETWKKSLFPQR